MALLLRVGEWVNDAARARGEDVPLPEDPAAREGVHQWLLKVTDPDTGRVGYVMRGTGPARRAGNVERFPGSKSEAMTAAACAVRLFWPPNDEPSRAQLKKGLGLLEALPPRWAPDGSIDLVYWQWGAMAAARAGGSVALVWERALDEQLVPAQRKDGDPCDFRGSFDPVDAWGAEGGRVYSTATAALALLAAHRYPR
jgi:hypothetical protein